MDREEIDARTQQDTRDEVATTPDAAEQAAMWDERYSESDRVWSGEPNGALVAEIAGLTPGTVLDVGCGEGADAVWLAQQGWDVTALDVSEVALERGRRAAEAAGVEVRWVLSGLVEAELPGFDLVSAQYPALLRSPECDAERALLGAVAPGGTLLFVHHTTFGSSGHGGPAGARGSTGVDPVNYVGPVDVVTAFDDTWAIETHEARDRAVTGGAGAHHHEDVVVRARRRV